MGETLKIFLTSGLTIVGGTIVYLLSQILSKFFVEPIYEQKRVISEISDTLIFYANIFGSCVSSDSHVIEIINKIRSLSTQLKAKTNFIPFYFLFEKLKTVTPKKDINEGCRALIGLSNSVCGTAIDADRFRKIIREKLKIDIN